MNAKKRLSGSEDLNALVASSMYKALKIDNNSKSKSVDDSVSYNESERFKFKELYIGTKSELY